MESNGHRVWTLVLILKSPSFYPKYPIDKTMIRNKKCQYLSTKPLLVLQPSSHHQWGTRTKIMSWKCRSESRTRCKAPSILLTRYILLMSMMVHSMNRATNLAGTPWSPVLPYTEPSNVTNVQNLCLAITIPAKFQHISFLRLPCLGRCPTEGRCRENFDVYLQWAFYFS